MAGAWFLQKSFVGRFVFLCKAYNPKVISAAGSGTELISEKLLRHLQAESKRKLQCLSEIPEFCGCEGNLMDEATCLVAADPLPTGSRLGGFCLGWAWLEGPDQLHHTRQPPCVHLMEGLNWFHRHLSKYTFYIIRLTKQEF